MIRALLLHAVAALLISNPVSAQEKAIAGFGEFIDPLGDCEVKVAKGMLTLRVPGGVHDLNARTGQVNGPRIMQEVEGDFTLQVKVTCELNPGAMSASKTSFSFNGAGLLVWQDERNFLRLERNTWMTPKGDTVCFPPLFEYFQGGKYMETNPKPTNKPFFEKSTHLRIDRRGDKVRAMLSHDGRDWKVVSEIPVDLGRKLKVGVAAVSTSMNPFTVEFEEFRVVSQ